MYLTHLWPEIRKMISDNSSLHASSNTGYHSHSNGSWRHVPEVFLCTERPEETDWGGGGHVGIVHMSWTGKPFVWDKGIYLTRKPRWNVHSLFLFLVIRSVTDVLRAQSRFVKFVGGGGEAAGRTPYTFNKPTLGPKYVSNRPYNEFITPTTLI